MDNLTIYNNVRSVPKEALKEIQAGRLRGKSDINPMWRIKALTEQFGPCGIGWKYIIKEKRLENGGNGEIAAFVDIDLFFKHNGEWSEAIPGTGGSSFVANEKNGPYVSDECFKMALTDAISVACKALGFAADVYWSSDTRKYTTGKEQQKHEEPKQQPSNQGNDEVISEGQAKRLYALSGGDKELCKNVIAKYGYKTSKDIKKNDYDKIAQEIEKEAKAFEGTPL